MLPKLDGLALTDEMRRKRVHTPVIVLTAKGSVDDRIKRCFHKRRLAKIGYFLPLFGILSRPVYNNPI